MSKLSKWDFCTNFKLKEFECPCGCGSVQDVDDKLLYALQYIRTLHGNPLNVIKGGGGRCARYNATLEGSIKNSNHIPGVDGVIHAADFQISGHCETLAKRKVVMQLLYKFPGFKYAYCNGAILRAGKQIQTYSAAWMGRSIHVSFK